MLRREIAIADGSVDEGRADIRRMLVERRRELLNEIHDRVRDVREEGSSHHHHTTQSDALEADPEDDLAFALIHMKAEMLERINEAVRQIDEGAYGYCVDCSELIAPSRLWAMPFAVRCRDCQEARENAEHRERVPLQRVPSGLGFRH